MRTASATEAVGREGSSARPKIVLYVCTFKRNGPLSLLLDSVLTAATAALDRVSVGVVVVDDNPDHAAEELVRSGRWDFELGIHYRHSGQQNISHARNLGMETAMELGDWVAMTDDDIVVRERWFIELLDVADRTGANAVTGPVGIGFPESAPSWLNDEPFSDLGILSLPEDEPAPLCSTGNSMIQSSWLEAHPEVRFDPALGTTGGEDGVFFRSAIQAGLEARFTSRAAIDEMASPERCTLRYQLRRSLWLGNSEFLTNHGTGLAGRSRLVLRGTRRIFTSAADVGVRLGRRQPPRIRWAASGIANGLGFWLGALGVRMEHA